MGMVGAGAKNGKHLKYNCSDLMEPEGRRKKGEPTESWRRTIERES